MKRYALFFNDTLTIFPRKEVNERNFRELLKNVNSFVIEVTKDYCGYSIAKYNVDDEGKSRTFFSIQDGDSLEEKVGRIVRRDLFKRGVVKYSISEINEL